MGRFNGGWGCRNKDIKLAILDEPLQTLFHDPGFCGPGDARFPLRDPIVDAIT